MIGRRFGKLVVTAPAGFLRSRDMRWLCRCDCGNLAIVAGGELRRNRLGRTSPGTHSCGCLRVDAPRKSNLRHGYFGTRLYVIWTGMKARCLNKKNHAAGNYSERGITLCKAWMRFGPFCRWALVTGYADNLSLDRKDNSKGYSPSNCRWVTADVQNNNKRNNARITFQGKTQTIAQWSREIGLHPATLRTRIAAGWTAYRALSTPARRPHQC